MFVYISATDNDFKPKTKAKSKLDKVIERIKKQDEAQGKKGLRYITVCKNTPNAADEKQNNH